MPHFGDSCLQGLLRLSMAPERAQGLHQIALEELRRAADKTPLKLRDALEQAMPRLSQELWGWLGVDIGASR